MKYYTVQQVFKEVPGEISLAFAITNCDGRCVGCHSKHLREDIGDIITADVLDRLIEEHKGITCILFLGGDWHKEDLISLSTHIKQTTDLKVAVYSGKNKIDKDIWNAVDYYKIGAYVAQLGGLDKPNTNQKMFDTKNNLEITYKFRKKKRI